MNPSRLSPVQFLLALGALVALVLVCAVNYSTAGPPLAEGAGPCDCGFATFHVERGEPPPVVLLVFDEYPAEAPPLLEDLACLDGGLLHRRAVVEYQTAMAMSAPPPRVRPPPRSY